MIKLINNKMCDIMSKMTHINKALAVFLLFGLVFTSFPSPTFATTPAAVPTTTSPMEWEESFAEPSFSTQCGYDVAQVDDCDAYISIPGQPALPLRTVSILLPPGISTANVRLEDIVTTRVDGSYYIAPAQEPTNGERKANPTEPDVTIYSLSTKWPQEAYEVVGVTRMRGYNILVLRVYPLSYVPAEGEVHLNSYIRFSISWAAEQSGNRGLPHKLYSGTFEAMVKEAVANPEAVNNYSFRSTSPISTSQTIEMGSLATGDPAKYVIITPSNFVSAAQPLAEWKSAKGIDARVFSLEDIVSDYTGDDDAEKMKNFISDCYSTWGTEWVLLAGDVGYVPTQYLHCDDGYGDVPSDYYFADLTGDWDLDNDQVYGEVSDDDVDWAAEVFVGRLPARTSGQLTVMVDKIIAYEQNAPTGDWRNRMLLCGAYSNYEDENGYDKTDEAKLKEQIRTDLLPASISYTRLYEAAGSDPTDYTYDYALTSSNVEAELAKGYIYVNFAGHGNYNGIYRKIWNDDGNGIPESGEFSSPAFVSQSTVLSNEGMLSLIYGDACNSAEIDATTSFGEYLVKSSSGGAIGYIGATRISWYSVGWNLGYGYNQELDYRFWEEFLNDPGNCPGEALYMSKLWYANHYNTSSYAHRKDLFTYVLLGDPEVRAPGTGEISYESHEIDDSVGGDDDGSPEPGESIGMPVTLVNTTNATFTCVTATLSTTASLTPTTLFSDDMEAGEGEWTYDGLWHLSEHRSDSPTHSWYYGQEGLWNYDTEIANSGSLTSPIIDLAGLAEATLSFWYWYQTETTYIDFDQRTIAISVNGGPFQLLEQLYGDTMSAWNEKTIDLSTYTGNTIQIRFNFATVDKFENYYEGWYIDDVALTGITSVSDPYITITDDYEEYGDIPASSSAPSLDDYNFDIDPLCPDGHIVTFNLDIMATNGGPWSSDFQITIYSDMDLVAKFSATPLSGDEPLSVDFTDFSTPSDGIASWLWDFGDSQNSTAQHPTHEYTENGTYTVSLTVTDVDGGNDTETKIGYITVSDIGPTADFSASTLSGDEPLTVIFTNNSTSHDGFSSWLWDFGDSQNSTAQHPIHEYTQDGIYTISLTVTDADGDNDTETKIDYITVLDIGPTADFSASPLSGDEPLTVIFTDNSTSYDGFSSWLWNFGDGQNSTEKDPIHEYTQDGIYTVFVTVTDADGDEDTETKIDYITVLNIGPTAGFSVSPGVEGLAGITTFAFMDTTSGGQAPYTYAWDFENDGTVDSTVTDPTQMYTTSGTYTVSLTVTDDLGNSDTTTTQITVGIRGDANADGNVNAMDITAVELIIMGQLPPAPWADANQDGNVNALDITAVELIIMTT